jgi:hypothetical protein
VPLGDQADGPGLVDVAGHDADLALPGVMIPGQFGPIRRDLGVLSMNRFTRAMSRTGMPSVIADDQRDPGVGRFQDRIAAPTGGTKISERSPRSCHRLANGVEDRDAVDVVPPLPGVTPADHLGAVLRA